MLRKMWFTYVGILKRVLYDKLPTVLLSVKVKTTFTDGMNKSTVGKGRFVMRNAKSYYSSLFPD